MQTIKNVWGCFGWKQHALNSMDNRCASWGHLESKTRHTCGLSCIFYIHSILQPYLALKGFPLQSVSPIMKVNGNHGFESKKQQQPKTHTLTKPNKPCDSWLNVEV